jgi:hypothetical protein
MCKQKSIEGRKNTINVNNLQESARKTQQCVLMDPHARQIINIFCNVFSSNRSHGEFLTNGVGNEEFNIKKVAVYNDSLKYCTYVLNLALFFFRFHQYEVKTT